MFIALIGWQMAMYRSMASITVTPTVRYWNISMKMTGEERKYGRGRGVGLGWGRWCVVVALVCGGGVDV